MSLSIVVIYTPMNIYHFYSNVNIEYYTYSWDAVHTSNWNDILYVPVIGLRTLDRWSFIGMAYLVFIFFGTGNDALEIYRVGLVKMGFSRIFPQLKEPRQRRGSSDQTWSSRLSLISRARSYFEERKSMRSHSDTTGSIL
jgi:pheromone a factor receptor